MTQADAVAIDRLRAWARLIERAPRDGEPFKSDEGVTIEHAADLRSLITAYESQAEREVEGALREANEIMAWLWINHVSGPPAERLATVPATENGE